MEMPQNDPNFKSKLRATPASKQLKLEKKIVHFDKAKNNLRII